MGSGSFGHVTRRLCAPVLNSIPPVSESPHVWAPLGAPRQFFAGRSSGRLEANGVFLLGCPDSRLVAPPDSALVPSCWALSLALVPAPVSPISHCGALGAAMAAAGDGVPSDRYALGPPLGLIAARATWQGRRGQPCGNSLPPSLAFPILGCIGIFVSFRRIDYTGIMPMTVRSVNSQKSQSRLQSCLFPSLAPQACPKALEPTDMGRSVCDRLL